MRKSLLPTCLLLGTINLVVLNSHGQEIVHALTGKVAAVNPSTKSIKISTDDGSEGLFYFLTKPDTPLTFQKSVRAETVAPATITKIGTRVLVYYFGNDAIRTVVALKDLGDGPFVNIVGTIERLDRHAHMVTIKKESGAEESFHIDAKTVGEAMNGAIEGEKFDADKGAKVRVIATNDSGAEKALFIREVSF